MCHCANALKQLGVKKGDRVTIYLPMIPEIAVAMLACTRIGRHLTRWYSPDSPPRRSRGRIADCQSTLVITADEGLRGGKRIPLKQYVDGALAIKGTECVKDVLVVRRTGAAVPMCSPRDRWYEDVVSTQPRHVRSGGNERGGPAVHPVYLRIHGQAQGRPAHDRRISGLRRIHASDPFSIFGKTISTGPPRTSAG